ncbi:poly(R)-hydroxyalkanoic acid synthase subunit PhaE [Aminipila sp.]|uniref:poly(R)-hydroxyalkanoic acid synthase subunit PhaE n=1 Tax=Aminipila sp. TaxID=2060095 RepID=UPI00289A2D51|nr:poly(R)-hydroxyalkanoic acid synthase subunit PhaE [Aminipila sp.]
MDFNNIIIEQFFDMQKTMLNVWQETFLPKDEVKNEKVKKEGSQDIMDFYKKMIDFNNKLFSSFNGGNVYEIFKKMSFGTDVYYNVYKLWEDLNKQAFKPAMNEYTDIYRKWKEEYMSFVKKSYIAYLPDPIQAFVKEPMEIMEIYKEFIEKFYGPWIESNEELSDYMVKGAYKNPIAYLDFIKLWKDNYSKSFGKILNSPAMGLNKEYFEKQRESMDTFVKYLTFLGEFSANLFSVSQKTMEDILNNYAEMLKSGTQPKTFKGFYEYWSKENENAYLKLFNTEDFSKLFSELVDSSMVFKSRYDSLIEEYLKYIPIPTKSEMKSLYKTVYDLKKQVKDAKKELNDLKGEKK